MKSIVLFITAMFFAFSLSAQEATTETTKARPETEIDMSLDIMSSYVWRGSMFGTGAAFQPSIELTSGNFTLGAWNNISTGSDQAYEVDLYTSYSFPFGVTLGLTDYYFEGNYLGNNFEDIALTHSLEPSFEYEYGELTIFAALMFMKNAETMEKSQDFYGEVTYSFELFDFGVGAGDGQYLINPAYGTGASDDIDFAICNISISTEKKIKITDSFSLPMKSAIQFNPFTERLYAYVGISL